MRRAWLMLLVGCGTTNGPPVTVTTTFPVTVFTGANPSPLDPLMGQTIAMTIVFSSINTAASSGPAGCTTRGVDGDTTRTASGPSAPTVQAQILDMLPQWGLTLQLCTTADTSSIVLGSVIDPLNLSFGCLGIPQSAFAEDATGYPELTSFEATQCSATILDVVANRVVGNNDFAMTIATGPAQIP